RADRPGPPNRSRRSETGDVVQQRFGQVTEAAGGLVVAADRAAVFLGHPRDRANLLGDLGGGGTLLAQGMRDLRNRGQHLLRRHVNAVHRRTGTLGAARPLADPLHALLHALHRAARTLLDRLDHLGDLPRRIGGALGQLAYLVGDHGEAATLFAGTRGLDCRVQGQQIGLRGDIADHADDGGYLARTLPQRRDGTRRVRHRVGDLPDFLDHRGDDLTALA